MNQKHLALALALVFVGCYVANGQAPCQYWHHRVDVYVELPDLNFPNEKDPEIIKQGIECLLKLEGNKNISRIGANPMPHLTGPILAGGPISIFSTPTRVEVAALYLISSLYYQRWDHANWVVLVNDPDSKEVDTSGDNVRRAYQYYREWFEQVKFIGVVKARELKLEPLKGKDVWWR
jgi:hypothetical protein